METPKIRIVTVGEGDALLLKAVFNSIGEFAFLMFPQPDLGAAMSLSSTVLSKTNDTVVLVLDQDSEHASSSVDYVRTLVGRDSERFRFIQMSPEIEILYFQDRLALEMALGETIPDMVWKIGQTSPKSALNALLSQANRSIDELLCSRELLSAMERNLLISEIIQFASSANRLTPHG